MDGDRTAREHVELRDEARHRGVVGDLAEHRRVEVVADREEDVPVERAERFEAETEKARLIRERGPQRDVIEGPRVVSRWQRGRRPHARPERGADEEVTLVEAVARGM